MSLQFGGTPIGAMQYNGQNIAEAMYEGEIVYTSMPTVQITGTGTTGTEAMNQFRQACLDYGTTYQTVQELPFQLDTSQATNLRYLFWNCHALISAPVMDTSQVVTMASMFNRCSSLTHVPDMDTSNTPNTVATFRDCPSLTDGNVRLIGKHPDVNTTLMIDGSGLTREPFFDSNGNPI